MAAVTAALVKELRDATGAGMMDCKKALVATDGDMDKAVDYLRENGLAKAAKKASRIASEGLVRMAFAADGSEAAAVEVNSETDFVAKNEEFVEFVEKLADIALKADKVCAECMKEMPYSEEGTVGEVLTAKIAKIGENMNLRRAVKCNTPGVKYVGYSHGGGRIGVIIGLKTEAPIDKIEVVGKDVAMQAASMRPQFVDEKGVDPEYLEHEKEVLIAQAMNETFICIKVDREEQAIIEKMITGRVKKSLKEVCLVDQAFVKDSNMSVGEYVASCAKALGKDIKVVEMVRYEVGEGIEKKVENFAEEVAKQMQG